MKNIVCLAFILLIPLGVLAQTANDPNQVGAVVPTNAETQSAAQKGNFCDPNYVGGTLGFKATAELYLDDLLYQIHNRFGINFLMGKDVANARINIRSEGLPWTTLLRSQLFLSGVKATCIGNNTIQLVKNSDLKQLQDNQEVKTTFIKLKYLQPTGGGNRDLAGRSSNSGGGNQGGCQQGGGGGSQQSGGGLGGQQSGGCGNFEKLIFEIQKILGINQSGGFGGGGGGQSGAGSEITSAPIKTDRTVSQIPGRNILLIKATDEELDLINQIIAKADRPPFQVVIKGLVYTANETKLRDIGAQVSILTSTADGRTQGSILGHTAGSGGTLFDFSTIIGTNLFSVEARALQQNGIIAIKSRPFAAVLDGETADLEVGRQIPVLTQGSVLGGQAGNLEFIGASNLLSITPFVIDDDNGNPVGVNLNLQLESNEVDTAVISQGIPTVNRRSIQTRLTFNQDKTIILGGFTVDSSSNDVSKTPGLGDLPILGYLFKRRVKRAEINRLYFAISVEIVPYGQLIEPVKVPGATTDVPTVTPEMIKPLDISKSGTTPPASNKPAPAKNAKTEAKTAVVEKKP
jgi:type II secretory pathway component GspD/PulD (secretin)